MVRFQCFNPIVELSLTFHNLVVGANGQRQAMFLENVAGLAAQILRNFDLSEVDTALVISSSGCNVVPIEMAEIFQKKGIKTVGIISKQHSEASTSKKQDGRKLQDFCEIVLDSGASRRRCHDLCRWLRNTSFTRFNGGFVHDYQ